MWNLAVGGFENSLSDNQFVRDRTLPGRCLMLGKVELTFTIASIVVVVRNWAMER